MKNKLTGYELKIIAVVTMLIDHVAAAVLERCLYADFPAQPTVESYNSWQEMHAAGLFAYDIMRVIGRIAFPIFAFLIVEGVLHTSDIRRYIKNLFFFALLSEVPYDLAFSHRIVSTDSQNVLFTLLIGVMMLAMIRRFTVERVPKEGAAKAFIPAGAVAAACLAWLYADITTCSFAAAAAKYDFFEKINFQWPISTVAWFYAAAGAILCFLLRKKLPASARSAAAYTLFISSIAIAMAKLLHTDYGGAGVLAILLLYLLRENHTAKIFASWAVLTLNSIVRPTAEIFCIFAAPFISLYNGERGRKTKYFFYIFYPAHLLILALISELLVK